MPSMVFLILGTAVGKNHDEVDLSFMSLVWLDT